MGKDTAALGGSETMLQQLAERFAKMNFEVFICGHVIPCQDTDVRYLDHEMMHQKFDNESVDLVIATNYIHFVHEFEHINAKKMFFWLHNTEHFPYWNGEELPAKGNYLYNSPNIDKIILVSDWHKKDFTKRYSFVDKKKIVVMENAVEFDLFPELISSKAKDSFVYSSAPDRGLKKLLEYFKDNNHHMFEKHGVKVKPYPPLFVYCPLYSKDWGNYRAEINESLTNGYYIGPVNKRRLYSDMTCIKYWLYPSEYPETSCITAMEVMMCGVKPIGFEKAGALERFAHIDFKNMTPQQIRDFAIENFLWEDRIREWVKLISNN